jgi:DNA repair exonuclease SbcCD ATPase subunit
VTDHDEIERVLAALDGGRMYVGPKDDRNVTKKSVARIIRELRDELAQASDCARESAEIMRRSRDRADELRAELARWKDPESPERQALQEEVILALGDGARSEIALRESQLAAAEAALDRLRADHEALRETNARLQETLEAYGDGGNEGPSIHAFIGDYRAFERLKADHEALRADFERYAVGRGAHREGPDGVWCDMSDAVLAIISDRGCTCGLDAARERWRKA